MCGRAWASPRHTSTPKLDSGAPGLRHHFPGLNAHSPGDRAHTCGDMMVAGSPKTLKVCIHEPLGAAEQICPVGQN